MKKYLVLLFLLTWVVFVQYAQAQEIETSAIAKPIDIQAQVEEGDVICSYSDGFDLCRTEFDNNIYGIIVVNPPVSFEAVDENGEIYPLVITSGIARIKVSAESGNISEGNKVTSSSTPGVAKLAARNGYVIGTALEDFEPGDPQQIGKILVSVNIHPATGISTIRRDLIRALSEGITLTLLSPLDVLRYILSAFVFVASFVFAFVYFGRVGKKAVEAIGRNPLAARLIQTNVFLHIIATVAIVVAGLIVSYLILIL